MIKKLLIFLTIILTALPICANRLDYYQRVNNSVWIFNRYAMQITFTNFADRGTLVNFPALVQFTPANTANYGGFLGANGYELRFWTNSTMTGGNLNYEIDSFTKTANSYIWVQVPSLTNNASIWASWGDPTATSQQPYTTNGAVWSESYALVSHLTSTNKPDSSPNRFAASVTNSIIPIAGMIDGGLQMLKTNAMLFAGPTFRTNRFSVSFWLKPNTRANYNQTIGTYSDWGAMRFHTTTAGGIYCGILATDTLRITPTDTGNNVLNVGQWNYWTFTCDASLLGTLYRDGVKLVSKTQGAPTKNWTGLLLAGGGVAQGIDGIIDEVQVSSIERSSNWVWACYMNQGTNRMSFQSYGAITNW